MARPRVQLDPIRPVDWTGETPPALSRVPKHVAVVMDGNGRWANRQGLTRIEGHRAGEAALLERLETRPVLGRQRVLIMGDQPRTRDVQDFLPQHLAFQARQARLREAGPDGQGGIPHQSSASAASCSA